MHGMYQLVCTSLYLSGDGLRKGVFFAKLQQIFYLLIKAGNIKSDEMQKWLESGKL